LPADALNHGEDNLEAVLSVVDLVNVGFVPQKHLLTTVVDKIKLNYDHSKVAFTVDIGNNERCTGGLKDMNTGKIDLDIKLKDISAIEFAKNDNLIFVELDDHNRPYNVKRKNLCTLEEQSLLVDDDPTHYIDISLSKDKEFIFINSATKEDSEIWVIDNREGNENFTPKLLLPRQKDVRIHIEHVRDFFMKISNNDSSSKNFKL